MRGGRNSQRKFLMYFDGKLSITEIAGYLAQRFWDDVEAKAA